MCSRDRRQFDHSACAVIVHPDRGAIEEDVQHIAVQTRTPRHYFLQQGQAPSGDAIKSAEAGLVAKVVERQRQYGRSFAELVRLRQAYKGEQPKAIETIWADPEFRTMGELTDAIIKPSSNPEETKAKMTRDIPLKRFGKPSEVADMCAALNAAQQKALARRFEADPAPITAMGELA